MNTSDNLPILATDVRFAENKIFVSLNNGQEIDLPLDLFPKLRNANSEALHTWRLIGKGRGIHWDVIDEDLSVSGLLKEYQQNKLNSQSLIWHEPNSIQEETVLYSINKFIKLFTEKNLNKFNINHSTRLLIFSDYSGEEAEANYYTYTFLIINDSSIKEWDLKRKSLRNTILNDNRRISYKNYRDRKSRKYIEEFVILANSLNGFLITFAFDKRIDTIFDKSARANDLNTRSNEKSLRIQHLAGFLASGFSNTNQNLLWITDNDSVVANQSLHKDFANSFSLILNNYLSHNLRHIQVGTTDSDDGTRLIEDLCSIADLEAGAYSDQLKTLKNQPELTKNYFIIHSPLYKEKTSKINLNNFSKSFLTRLYFKIDLESNNKLTTSFFHTQNQE